MPKRTALRRVVRGCLVRQSSMMPGYAKRQKSDRKLLPQLLPQSVRQRWSDRLASWILVFRSRIDRTLPGVAEIELKLV